MVKPVINPNCFLPFEYFNGQSCVCLNGYQRVNSICQAIDPNAAVICQSNSKLVGT